MDRICGGAVVVVAVSATLLLAGPAAAGTLSGAPFGGLHFTADDGVANLIGITKDGDGFRLFDLADEVTLGSGTFGCAQVLPGTSTVSCPLAAFLVLSLGDQNDVVSTGDVSMSMSIDGGGGSDTLEGGTGDDSVYGGVGNDDLQGGNGDDWIRPGDGADTADGGSGSDTLDYNDGRVAGVTVDLGVGTAPDGDVISTFENAVGSDFADDLTGTTGDNLFLGNDGGDTIRDGGGGVDTLSYLLRPAPVTVSLGSNTNNDGDVLVGQWEGLIGTFHADHLSADGVNHPVTIDGLAGADVIFGGKQDDLLIGGFGADSVFGGLGTDVASYRERESHEPVTASMSPVEPGQEGDLFTAIETLEGGAGNDTLRGDAGANTLIGNLGADTLVGGGGADALYGNTTAGTPDGAADTASYDDGRTSPVITELAGGHQDGDFYSDIQNLIGGDGNDLLVGDIGRNALIGNNGADILVGADGIDDLRGGLPNGNADVSIDVASYRDWGVPVVAALGGPNPDGDLFSDINGLEGGGAGDTLTGDAFANLLLGGAGNDTLTGGAGADDLQAGEGEDSLQGRDGERDSVNCGPGTDTHDEDGIDVLTDCEDIVAVVPRPPAVLRCVVPNVKRRTVAHAKRLLTAKRCRLGKVLRVYSRKVRKGWIVSQSRRPGARLARNAKVNVVVSRGRGR